MVWPTAEPTATPAAVVAICAIRPGCFGAGAATAEAGAAAGTGARAAGAGDAALICGARLAGGATRDVRLRPPLGIAAGETRFGELR